MICVDLHFEGLKKHHKFCTEHALVLFYLSAHHLVPQVVSLLLFCWNLCFDLPIRTQCFCRSLCVLTGLREWRQVFWVEFRDRALVQLVVGILLCRDKLGEPGRGLEEDDISHRANCCPVPHASGQQAAPLVQNNPERLFCSKIGMARVRPQALRDKAAVEIGLLKVGRHFGSLLVFFLCILIVPLLLVGDSRDKNHRNHDLGTDRVTRSP